MNNYRCDTLCEQLLYAGGAHQARDAGGVMATVRGCCFPALAGGSQGGGGGGGGLMLVQSW